MDIKDSTNTKRIQKKFISCHVCTSFAGIAKCTFNSSSLQQQNLCLTYSNRCFVVVHISYKLIFMILCQNVPSLHDVQDIVFDDGL